MALPERKAYSGSAIRPRTMATRSIYVPLAPVVSDLPRTDLGANASVAEDAAKGDILPPIRARRTTAAAGVAGRHLGSAMSAARRRQV